MMTDLIPPQALDVEKSVLGSMMNSKAVVAQAMDMLTEACFFATAHKTIYLCLVEMYLEDLPFDVISVSHALRDKGQLDAVGGEGYLADLSGNIATYDTIAHHATILLQKHASRIALSEAIAIANMAANDVAIADVSKRISDLHNTIANSCDDMENGSTGVKVLNVKNDLTELTKQYFAKGEQAQVCELKSLPNLGEIYKPVLGFLNVWTGIPSHGKTELLNQVMVDLSVNHDWKWLVFSPESYPHYYMVQNYAEKLIGKGFHRGEQKMHESELDAAIEHMSEHINPIDVGDAEFSSDDFLALVREQTSKGNIQGVVVDPIGDLEISVRKSENYTYAIRRFLRIIRLMGRRKEFSPFIVAHTTKMVKDFKTKKYPVPTLYDIDGSAAYYNAAYHGISTFRYFKLNVIAVHVQKVKFKPAGEIGVRYLQYNRDNGSFSPYYMNPEKEEENL